MSDTDPYGLLGVLTKNLEDHRELAREEQQTAFTGASANLIALINAAISDKPLADLEKIAHDYLRWQAHFTTAVQAAGELVV